MATVTFVTLDDVVETAENVLLHKKVRADRRRVSSCVETGRASSALLVVDEIFITRP